MTVASTERMAQAIDVPTSDGVTLAALRLPAARTPAPVVVLLTPYRKENFQNQLVQAGVEALGCEVIVADVRGTGGSGGDWDGPHSPREIADGVELVDWIAGRDFCDGGVALVGASYCALNALLIAARRPRGLRCVTAVVAPVDAYRDLWRRGGMPSHTNWGANGGFSHQHRPDAQRRILEDFYLKTAVAPFDDARFRSRSVEDRLAEIDVPVMLVGGWYDYFLRGTLRAFQGLRAPKRLVIGNSGHRVELARTREEGAAWLRYWLYGEGDDPTKGANVVLQRVGTEVWTAHERWPDVAETTFERWQPVTAPRTLGVTTSFEGPALTIAPVPPTLDLSTNSGMRLWGEAWTADTPPVEKRTCYRGPVGFTAVLSSAEAADLDVHARLSIVRADGRVEQVTEGRLRASHRALDRGRSQMSATGDVVLPWHPHERAEPLLPGEPATLNIEIFPINLELSPGEGLRLGITILRVDEVVAPTSATLLPETALLLPLA